MVTDSTRLLMVHTYPPFFGIFWYLGQKEVLLKINFKSVLLLNA